MRSTWTVAVVVALAATVVAVVLATDGGRSSGPGVPEAARPSAGPEAPPALRGRPDLVPPRPSGARTFLLEGTVRRGGMPARARLHVFLDRRGAAPDALPGPPELEAVGAATSDGAGRFAVPLGIPGRAWVLATDEAGGRAVAAALLDAARPRAHVDLDLEVGTGRLEGRAVDEAGAPWIGTVRARDAARWWGVPTTLLPATTTDAAGRFAFDHLAEGTWQPGAEVGGSEPLWGDACGVPASAPCLLVVRADDHELSGRVVAEEDGRPVAGATVVVSLTRETEAPQRWPWVALGSRHARADGDGRVRLWVPGGTLGGVLATAPGFAPGTGSVPVGGTSFLVALSRPAVLEGVVQHVDAAGTGPAGPAGGVTVLVTGSVPTLPSGWRVVRETGPDGRFRVEGLPPGSATVRAWGGGFVDTPGLAGAPFPATATLLAGRTARVDLLVEPGLRVEGRVLGADGAPSPNAEVWLEAAYGQAPPELLESLRTRADAVGGFRLEGLPRRSESRWISDPLRVVARGEDGSLGEAPLDRDAPSPLRVDLRLAPPRYVEVRVLGETGPLSGALAGLFQHGGSTVRAVTDAGGRARVGPLLPGSYQVSASAPGHRPASDERILVTVGEDGDPSTEVRLVRSCRIAGRVVFADGSPLRDKGYATYVRGPRHAFSTEEQQGRFVFEDLPRDTYEVFVVDSAGEGAFVEDAGDPRVVGHAVIGPDDEPVTIVLSVGPPRLRTVHVVGGDGTALARGRLRVLGAPVEVEIRSGWAWGVDVVDGTASLTDPPPEVWIEVVPAPGAGPWGRTRVGPVGDGDGPIEVRLPPAREAGGRVVLPDGRPAAGLQVEVWQDDEEPSCAPFPVAYAETRTDAEGGFSFARLPPEVLWAVVRVPDDLVWPEPVRFPASDEGVVIRLVARVAVAVRVLGADGAPLANADVSLAGPPWYSNIDVRARTDADGNARLVRVDPTRDAYLVVTPPETAVGSAPLHRRRWRPASETLRMPPAPVVRGQVVHPDGRPASGASVLGRVTDAHGAFAFAAATDGPVRLRARLGDLASDVVEARPGDAPVTLRLGPRAGRLRVEVRGWPPDGPEQGGWERSGPHARVWDVRDPGEVLDAVRGADGVFEVSGLDGDARYACLVLHDGHPEVAAFAADLAPDGSVHRLPLVATVPLRGRVVLPANAWPEQVGVAPAGVRATRGSGLEDDGRFVVPGLPPGPWTVTAWAVFERQRLHASARAEGERVPDLVIAAPR